MTAHDEELGEFRDQVRDWCEEHVPAGWREHLSGAGHDEYLRFQEWWRTELHKAGYLAPHWPVEWGGSSMSVPKQIVLYEELARGDAPQPAPYQVALFNAGPTILGYGSEEQKQRFLPKMLDGQVWCQGFSEPEAGSDLASLRTQATRHGDHYRVRGQKVWTSHASDAERCILLARTGLQEERHRSLSYFLLDMHAPGVEIRPIRKATGDTEFYELFLDDVEIPIADRVGDEGKGWRIAMGTLASERAVVMVSLIERLRHNGVLSLIRDAAEWSFEDGTPMLTDRGVREQLADRYARATTLRLLGNRLIDDIIHGDGAGPEASIIKVLYSELLQDLTDLAVHMQGADAHLERPLVPATGQESGDWMNDFVNSYSWTIAGGTNEIQRNILGEQVLGLPR